MGFLDKIRGASERADSLVCVGLDTAPERLPRGFPRDERGMLEFNAAIIEATSDLVCAYKPNSAFYEALGSPGIETLRKTCGLVPRDIPVILDVKRGDIGNTAERYAVYAYEIIGVDAVTVNPYMGFDAVSPFMREGKCVFVLCLTSNPSAEDFQFLESGKARLFETVAEKAAGWSGKGGVGLVVGATRPGNMRRVREIAPGLPLLVPGVGAQGGDVERVVAECGGENGLTIINSSRSILYASSGVDFREAARERTLSLREEINRYRRRRS